MPDIFLRKCNCLWTFIISREKIPFHFPLIFHFLLIWSLRTSSPDQIENGKIKEMENGKLFTLSFLWTHLWARSFSFLITAWSCRKRRAYVPKEYESKGEKRMKRKNKKKVNKEKWYKISFKEIHFSLTFFFLFLFFSWVKRERN